MARAEPFFPALHHDTQDKSRSRALFGMLIARQITYYIWPTLTFTVAVWKESLIWLCVIAWANILIALALGVILSVFYVWRRDLVANMIAHFLVDFIGNIH